MSPKRINYGALCTWKGGIYAVLIACLFWVYWPTLIELVKKWAKENNYSHGFLVPVFGVYLLYLRREKLKDVRFGIYWWGLFVFAVGGCLRLTAAYVYFDWLDGFSLIIYLAGLVILAGGKPGWGWAWPAVVFLVFMIPLPYRFERSLSFPLQRFATKASAYVLQTVGIPALDEGNVIQLQEGTLGIVEACNGLGMLVSFLALCTGVAIIIRRPFVDKIIIIMSAIPIALISNVIRIATTGILQETAGSELANVVFHDLAGWFLMPLALIFLWIEMQILTRLLVIPQSQSVSPLVSPGIPGVTKAAKGQAKLSRGRA